MFGSSIRNMASPMVNRAVGSAVHGLTLAGKAVRNGVENAAARAGRAAVDYGKHVWDAGFGPTTVLGVGGRSFLGSVAKGLNPRLIWRRPLGQAVNLDRHVNAQVLLNNKDRIFMPTSMIERYVEPIFDQSKNWREIPVPSIAGRFLTNIRDTFSAVKNPNVVSRLFQGNPAYRAARAKHPISHALGSGLGQVPRHLIGAILASSAASAGLYGFHKFLRANGQHTAADELAAWENTPDQLTQHWRDTGHDTLAGINKVINTDIREAPLRLLGRLMGNRHMLTNPGQQVAIQYGREHTGQRLTGLLNEAHAFVNGAPKKNTALSQQ